MKIAPIISEMNKHPELELKLLHTGQHYDAEMSKFFFEDLRIPEPDRYLGVGSGNHGEQTGKIMIEFEKVLVDENPDLVLVVGDVNSTIACGLVAVKLGVKFAHVEAGLRSFDRTMPGEINRLLTDQISDFLFIDFLKLMSEAKLVLTDSGGIQKETTVLGIPCLTLRENTERPVTVLQGTNEVIGVNAKGLVTESRRILNGTFKKGKRPDLWDGNAARRLVDVLVESFKT